MKLLSCRARWTWFVCALAFLTLPAPLAAQVRDTIPQRDTAAVADTAAADSVIPPPTFVSLPRATRMVRSAAVWDWSRAELLNEGAIALLDLLEQVPGLLPLRSGVFLQPERATALGTGSAHTIVEVDGYVLDPLIGPALDLSAIELTQLESVHVERRGDVLRIRLSTLQPTDGRAYSLVEAGLGEPTANLFRGTLLTPHFFVGPLGLAIERFELEGAGEREPAESFGSWVKWGLLNDERGIQFEFRNNSITREQGSPAPLDHKRRDVILRARNQFAAALVGEIYGGRSIESEKPVNPELPDSLLLLKERVTNQFGARLGWRADSYAAEATIRFRDNDWLPSTDAEFSASAGIAERVQLGGGAQYTRWRDGQSGIGYHGNIEISILPWLHAFGQYGSTEGGAPAFDDTTGVVAYLSKRTSLRAGAEGQLWRLEGGGALLQVETDSFPTFGLLPDSAAPIVAGGKVTGWEAWGRLNLLGDWLDAVGTYTTWLSGTRWAYLPASMWRAGLDLHAVPLPSGNLEINARIEAKTRGEMRAPPGPEQAIGETLLPRTVWDAYLQIRIIDVRIFARLDDMAGKNVEDLPGLPVRGPRFIYGVKWSFWN